MEEPYHPERGAAPGLQMLCVSRQFLADGTSVMIVERV